MTVLARSALFAGILGAVGCGGIGHSWGVGGGSVSRFENGETISYAVERLTCDGRAFLLLAANGCKGHGSSGGSGDFHGTLRTTDGREVAWSCRTADGKAGKVVVDGAEFDLADGRLLLINTNERPTRVELLALPDDRLQAAAETKTFPDLAKDEPKVAAFLETCKSRP